MLEDAIPAQQSPPPPAEQVSVDELSSPINARIFELYDSDLFQDTLQNSEVTSSSNVCHENNSPYAANVSIALDPERKFNINSNLVNTPTTPATTSTTATTATNNSANNTANNSSNLSILFDSQEELENDISASIDFSSSPSFSVPPFLTTEQDQFNFSSVQPQIVLGAGSTADGVPQYSADTVPALMGASLAYMFEEDCLSSVPAYVPLNSSSTSCSFLSPAMAAYMPTGHINPTLSADSSGMLNGNIILGSELQPKDLDYQGENGGIYCPDSRVFNTPVLQALTCASQQLVAGPGSAASLTPDISTLEDSAFKVGKLSVEQRKEKIHRYMKKRNQRNFSKKIKYACRKTLADSRPRVRGRFAKNEEFSETQRQASSNHEEEDDEEGVVKEEFDMVDSSDIFAHISGVNSFKCNYSLQSWI